MCGKPVVVDTWRSFRCTNYNYTSVRPIARTKRLVMLDVWIHVEDNFNNNKYPFTCKSDSMQIQVFIFVVSFEAFWTFKAIVGLTYLRVLVIPCALYTKYAY